MALLWLVVGTTAVATAVNERELRRRRYDAETLAVLATQLHADDEPDAVLTRLLDVVTTELDVPRALVARRIDGRYELAAARGNAQAPSIAVGRAGPPGLPGLPAVVPAQPAAPVSALLDRSAPDGEPVLALRLDPGRDPWLDRLLPAAARLVVVPVTGAGQGTWVVAELGQSRGGRAQRRVLSSLQQAVATAALAHSRAELLADARRAASTDGLTGVANRRSFDGEIDRLARARREQGVPYALVLVDVDHFKSVNDTLGHQAGDEVLQVVAQVLASAARPGTWPPATAARSSRCFCRGHVGRGVPRRRAGPSRAARRPGADQGVGELRRGVRPRGRRHRGTHHRGRGQRAHPRQADGPRPRRRRRPRRARPDRLSLSQPGAYPRPLHPLCSDQGILRDQGIPGDLRHAVGAACSVRSAWSAPGVRLAPPPRRGSRGPEGAGCGGGNAARAGRHAAAPRGSSKLRYG